MKRFITIPTHIKDGKRIKGYVKRIKNLTYEEKQIIKKSQTENTNDR